MCKIKYIFLLVFFFIACACDQLDISPNQADSFVKYYGASGSDIGNDIKQFNDGYIILATVTSENGNTDIAIIQTDKYGNPLSGVDTISSVRGGNNYASELQLTSDGGFVVVGTVVDTASNNQSDIYVGKFTSSVDLEWEEMIGSDSYDEIGSSIENLNSGYIVAGSTDNNEIVNGKTDVYLVKLDELGNTVWAESYGGAEDEYANDVVVTDYGYLIVGTTNSFNEPGQAEDNILIIKTNLSGSSSPSDKMTYGSSNNDLGSCLIKTEGSYLIVGTVENSVGDNSNIYVAKVEEDLRTLPLEKELEVNVGLAYDVVKSNGGYIIVGSTNLTTGSAGYFVKIDGSGEKLIEKTYGGYGQAIRAIEPTYDGGFIMVGSSGAEGNEMVYVLKVNSDGEF